MFFRTFCLMFLIDAIKAKVEKKLKLVLFFARLFREGELKANKIKPVLYLFALGLWRQQKIYSKETRKHISISLFLSKVVYKWVQFIYDY